MKRKCKQWWTAIHQYQQSEQSPLISNHWHMALEIQLEINVYNCKEDLCNISTAYDDYCYTLIFNVSNLISVVLVFVCLLDWIITLLPFFIEMLQYDWLWSGHMIIKEMFYIPKKLKPELARASMTTSDVNNQWRSNFQQQII
jgi:hypothetical protein